MKPVCPICRNALPNEDRSAPFPFCSARCKTIDLGRWLNEEYRVPVQPEDGSEDVPSEEESS